MVFQGIGTESLECSEYDQESRPAVVKRKWKMDEKFIQEIGRGMEFLDDVVDVLRALSLELIHEQTVFEMQPTVTAELTRRAKTNAASSVSLACTSATKDARTDYIVAGSPKLHIGATENSQKCETPVDSINNNLLSFRGKLIDDGTQEEEVDQ